MAISETITVDAAPAIAGLDAFAAAAEGAAAKFEAAFGKLKIPDAGGGAGAGKMAASMDAAAGKIEAAVSKIEASLGKLAGAGDAGAAGIGRMEEAAVSAGAALGEAALGADDLAAANGRLAATADAATAGLDRQAVAGGRASKSSAESAAGGTKFWAGLKTVLLGAGVAAAYGIDRAMKFQSQMLLLHTQAGVSMKDTQAMTQGVLLISTQTGQSLNAVAESAYHVASNMASMGGTPVQMLKAVKIAAEGASVGHSNLVDTTTALTSVLASGIPGAKDYSQAMGAINATVGSGEMNMQQLAEAMGTGVVPVVKGYGLTLKDVGAALATYGDLNIRGAHAGTQLRMAVQALAVPMKTGPLKEYGLTMNTLANDMEKGGLLKALDDLQGRFHKAGLTAANEGQAITALFGKKAGAGLALLMENLDRFQGKFPYLTQQANSFGKAWQATQQSPAQKWKEAVAGLQASATGFGTQLLPAFSTAVGWADKLLASINSSRSGARDIAVAFGGMAALFTAKKLTSGIESAVKTAETGLRITGKVAQVLNIPGLDKLAGIGQGAGLAGAAEGLTGAAGSLDAAAGSLEAAAGKLGAGGLGGAAGAAGAGEAAAGAEGAVAGRSLMGKVGSAIGAAAMTAAGAWIIGHVTGAFLPDATKANQQQYKSQVPGWLQGAGNFVFGGKAPALYGGLPTMGGPVSGQNWKNWYHDVFGGGAPKAPPALSEVLSGYHAPAVLSEVLRPNPKPVLSEVLSGYSPPAPKPVLSEVLSGYRAPAPAAGPAPGFTNTMAQALNIKPVKLPPPDISEITAAKGKVQAALSSLSAASIKPAKVPAPDMAAVNAAKGAAAAAGAGVTSAMQASMKPPKAPPPDLAAFAAAKGAAQADGAAISAGLASGIMAGAGAAIAAAHAVASQVAAAMAGALAVRSPSKVTQKIGSQAVDGLVLGLQGGKSAVDAAATALGKNAAKAADLTTIAQAITKAEGYVKTDSPLVKWLKGEQGKLTGLANQRARLEAEIGDSEQIAQNAISSASIMNAGTYTPADAASGGPLAADATISGMQSMAADQAAFAQQIARLQKSGLNATSLSQIVQAGASTGLPVAQGITSGGPGVIAQINKLEAQIRGSAAKLGDAGAPSMYAAGKSVAAGLASGLKADLAGIDKAMTQMADQVVAVVRKKLKVKSPSEVFREIGASLPAGLALGVDAGSPMAAAAAGKMASAAVTAGRAGARTGWDGAAHPVVPPGGYGGGSYGGRGGQVVNNYVTHVHVQGSVTAEKSLAQTLQVVYLNQADRNLRTGLQLPGRGA